MIYLASPYWNEDPTVRDTNAKRAISYAKYLMSEGHLVYCPFIYSRGIEHLGEDYWTEHSYEMAKLCDRLFVLKLEGWEESAGVKREMELFKRVTFVKEGEPFRGDYL